MLHFSNTTHTIAPSNELEMLLNKISILGSYAKLFGDMHVYDLCKQQYESISREWTNKAETEARAKSYRSWPAGGENYLVQRPMDWEDLINMGDQLNRFIDMSNSSQRWKVKKDYEKLFKEIFH